MNLTTPSPKGISEKNRLLLTTLHRQTRGPFTAEEAGALLSLNVTQAQRFLAYLAARGWLVRIRTGLYAVVPMDTAEPSQWREDPWVVASKVFAPDFYLAGWTACENWGLTEQIFRETMVFTTRKVRSRTIEIQGFPFRVKSIAKRKIFGTKTVWRAQVRIQVSDPTRTIVDILDDPSVGGGIRHVTDALETYLQNGNRNDALLVEYGLKLGNRAVFKRLGYLLERLQVAAPDLVDACKKEMSSGVSLLDPTMPPKGPIIRRWNLRLNATPRTEEANS